LKIAPVFKGQIDNFRLKCCILGEVPKKRLQEEVCGSQRKFALHFSFNAFTYSAHAAIKVHRRFSIEIERKRRALA
jgi:hypothetical protein